VSAAVPEPGPAAADRPPHGSAVLNMLTIDVEDWQQSTLDQSLPVTERAERNTERMLALLAEHRTRATFFVQGMVAELYPDLVRRIVAEGHEVGSHGHGHAPIFQLTPEEFRADLRRAAAVLRPLTGAPLLGYRAPDFSIRQDTLWAPASLAEGGFRYSSSIFPFAGSRYGIAGADRRPHTVEGGLLEVPLSVVDIAGRPWPVGGGGYLRLYPYALTRWALRRLNREQRRAVVYLHPYEIDSEEMRGFRGRIPWKLYVTQSLNRDQTERKLRALLRDFSFVPVREVIDL